MVNDSGCHRAKQRGVALISALMVLVILAIIAGCFAMVMNRDVRQARNSMFQVVCLNAAQAGIDYAIWLHKHNMACYPLVDYPGATEQEKNDNRADIPDYFYENGVAYNYSYGLKLGAVYNLPAAVLKSGGKNYDPAADRLGQYVNNITSSSETKDTEYMFVNDLSLWSSPGFEGDDVKRENFMHDTQMCVTFQIRESLEGESTDRVLHIVSTGKIRKVPNGYDWTDKSKGWLSLFGKDGEGNNFDSESLTSKGFKEYASRTLSVDLSFGNGGNFPAIVTATSEDYATNRQNQMPERRKREWFR